MKNKKIDIILNQEDVQNIIDCYEKDIELIEKLKEKNEIYKSTMKGQHRRIEELKQAKKVSKQIQKERNKRLRKENELLKERIEEAIDYIENYAQVYEANPILDEFNIQASPKELINILKGGK